MSGFLKKVKSYFLDAGTSIIPPEPKQRPDDKAKEAIDAEEAMLAHICENDAFRMREARRNEKYRAILTELSLERDIRAMFTQKYHIHFQNIYLDETRINWQSFNDQVAKFSGTVSPEDCIDGVYFLLMDAARQIRNFSSREPGWENIWSEQTFNQIKSVVTTLRDELKPVFDMKLDEGELHTTFNTQFSKVRDKFEQCSTEQDAYWLYILDSVEGPLREAIGIE